MKKKIVKSKKRVPKFQDGGIGKLKPRTALEAAKNLKIGPFIGPLNEADTAAKDKEKEAIIRDLIEPKAAITASPTVTPKSATTPKSVAAKNSKTVSDSYKKSLQGLMDKGKSIDDLVKLGYGTKQGLTNLGLTAPKKATAPKSSTPKKGVTPKSSTPKKPTASDLKKEGQRLKAEGLRQKGIGMAIKGKALRNKAIDKTLYENKYSSSAAKALIKLGADPKKPNRALRAIEAAGRPIAELKMLVRGKNRYSTDEVPSKSKLTETEKKAIAKYKASPKYKKTLKLDTKKIKSSDELAKSNYGNNIVGDLMSGPVKAGAAAVGAAYGLYKAGKIAKNLSNVGKSVTKSIATRTAKAGTSQIKANLAKFARNAKSTVPTKRINKISGKVNADKLKVMTKRSATQRGGLEKVLNQSTKTAKSPIKKKSEWMNAGTSKKYPALKIGGKITKMKRGGKKC
jgi:hypothetical protein